MSILADFEIALCALHEDMIHPFVDHQVKEGDRESIISYGLSSYGYDIRITNEFATLDTNLLDPKQVKDSDFRWWTADVFWLPPQSFVLAKSVEYFKIPRGILAICVGKSTYARCGVIVNVTPVEPQWEGHLTIEISNTASVPVLIYANEGIAQLIFHRADEPCSVSYADRKGKYQGQQNIIVAKM